MTGLTRQIVGSCVGVALALLIGAGTAHAQSINIDLGAGAQAGATGRLVQLTALITVLSLAPSLLVMGTAFTRIVIVLSLLRSAIGAQLGLGWLGTVSDILCHAASDGTGLDGWDHPNDPGHGERDGGSSPYGWAVSPLHGDKRT